MPVKKFGGGNKKRRGAGRRGKSKTYSLDDLIPSKDDGQAYAFASDKFGDGRYSLMCYDKVTRMGIVAGRLKRTARILKGNLVLVSLRDYQDDKCDIIYHYTPDDIDKLVKNNKINDGFVKSGTLTSDEPVINTDTVEAADEADISVHPDDDISPWGDDGDTVNKHSKDIIKDINDDFGDFGKSDGYDEINIDDL